MRDAATLPLRSLGGGIGGVGLPESRRLSVANVGRLMDEPKLGDMRQRDETLPPSDVGGLETRLLPDAMLRGGAGDECVERVEMESLDLLVLLMLALLPLPKKRRLNDDRLLRTPSTAPDCG